MMGPKKGTLGENDIRHPPMADEIEPMVGGRRAEWSGNVNDISTFISVPKTDWLNQGMIRPREMLPGGGNNSHLFPVRSLIKLRDTCPTKFHRDADRVFASMRSGDPIKPDRAASLLRMAAPQQCHNPSDFSLRSMRGGRSTALYRAHGILN